jgi:hypothetical protein
MTAPERLSTVVVQVATGAEQIPVAGEVIQ